MPFLMKLSLIISYSLLSAIAFAGTDHSHEHKHQYEQKTHIHGVSEIQIVMGENQIEIQFESPANNIVGFEHNAKTAKEMQAVENAQRTLEQPQTLFTFIGASCTTKSTRADLHELLDQHKEKNHKEISVYYQFSCSSLESLQRIDLNFFSLFSNITEIHIQWVSSINQGQSVLTPNNHQLRFEM